jgi:hypothetical protein
VIKSRKMRRVGHVVLNEREERCIQGFGGEASGKDATWETQKYMGA